MTNVCQYFILHPPARPDFWGKWGPSILMSSATVLLLVAPLKNLVVNVCMKSFRDHGYDSTIEFTLNLAYKPIFAERHMWMYTFVAYLLMSWGTALQVGLVPAAMRLQAVSWAAGQGHMERRSTEVLVPQDLVADDNPSWLNRQELPSQGE
eukprot:CAMPEP_0178419078 /NCGR_PEP_ID=MMETSP0689_2-20121128/25422_1 /TAXON_ID=160604 /ORGANISM="Amphidinium massartii, Strain CS-259" /LENGTH=150 /DNA_ID=CAMNT_0020040499 /DNA_START=368 /DNA_END=821 /DNA_ORIENTATION=+